MPDIEIVKLKLRRGTDAQRQSVTLEQGEMGYTTDAKRVWVGDGFTPGGHVTGNLVHSPITVGSRTDLTEAALNDIVYDNNLLYQLSGAYAENEDSWAFIGSQTDGTTLDYNANNKLHVLSNSISATNLHPSVVKDNGGLTFNSNDGISANVDNTTIGLTTTGSLSVIQDPIPSNLIGNGLSGGSGEDLGVLTTDSFTFDGLKLEFNNAPVGTVQACAIDYTTVTNGLSVTGNQLGMEVIGGNVVHPFNTAGVDIHGRVTSTESSIVQNLSGTNDGGDYANIFFGSLNADSNDELTVDALSGNGAGSSVAIQLSSAGFIQIASGNNGNFAIPVFKF